MLNKPAPTTVKIHRLMQERWSPRAFDASKSISPEILSSLLEAARWAPSSSNEQPWRFIVCDKHQNAEAWQRLLDCVVEKNQEWAQHAPLLILAIAVEQFSKTGKANRWAAYDTGAATLSLCLQATDHGLVSHQMGGFDAECCRRQFQLPENATPMSVIALGYQAEPEQLSEEMQQRERAERSREPLEQRFFMDR